MSVEVKGLAELNRAIDRLPFVVSEALKRSARESAERIARNAASILRSKTHGTGATAEAIRVLDESSRKQYVVNSPGHPDRPAMLPMWLEYGTRFMAARPYMRPAGDMESERYRVSMTAAAERAAKVLG